MQTAVVLLLSGQSTHGGPLYLKHENNNKTQEQHDQLKNQNEWYCSKPHTALSDQSIPDIIEKNSVVTVSEVTEPESLKYMEGHEWNIDEINFLAKRMESFDKREKRQFDAIASQLKPSTGQDLINQTFKLSRYTLISDFSSLTEIGKTHVINRKQAMSFDEMASTDFGSATVYLGTHGAWQSPNRGWTVCEYSQCDNHCDSKCA